MAGCAFPIVVGIPSASVLRGGHNRDRKQRIDAFNLNISGKHLADESDAVACFVADKGEGELHREYRLSDIRLDECLCPQMRIDVSRPAHRLA